jgi:ribosomal protein S12 methylthiotransferase
LSSEHTSSRSISFYIENLGCAKNQVDAETIIAALEARSHKVTRDPAQAQLIIVNTCGFLEEARRESIEVTLDLRNRFPQKRILLAGCFAQRDGLALARMLPEIDGVFGNRALGRISEVVDSLSEGERPVLLPEGYESGCQGAPVLSYPGSAYLKIAEGCDNRCSYCAIPLIRGRLRSRTPEEINADALRFIESGVAEINLIAQDLGSYGNDLTGANLPDLITSILEIPGRYWLRMLYIHPDKFPAELLDICRSDERLLPYFDIPLQHASRRILKTMGRKGDALTYGRLIEKIRKALPDAVVRTTFLVGFPGETERDLAELLKFQEDVQFDWLGAFRYSREKGTPAAAYGLVPRIAYRMKKPLVNRRLDRVLEAQQRITGSRIKRYVDRSFEVLIEERIKGEQLYLGRIYAQAPEVDGLTVVRAENLSPGTFVRCRMVKANGIDLEAVPE